MCTDHHLLGTEGKNQGRETYIEVTLCLYWQEEKMQFSLLHSFMVPSCRGSKHSKRYIEDYPKMLDSVLTDWQNLEAIHRFIKPKLEE